MLARNLGVGIGAGLASALLIAVIVKATPLALALYLLAPLPILIVALGWDHRAGLAAAATGGLVLALVASPLRGLAFAATTALPAWWLAYLALLGRPADASPAGTPGPTGTPGAAGTPGATEWYPLGRLLGWIALTCSASLLAVAVLSTGDYGAFRERTRLIVGAFVRAAGESASGMGPGAGDDAEGALTEAFVRAVPALAALGSTLLLTVQLWAAARIVRISGRLPRPWPDVPGTRMPRLALAGLALGVALAGVGHYPGVLGAALVGALVASFALQGLAGIHDRTRGRPGRGLILFGLYLILLLSNGIALVALTLFGLADTALGPRRAPGRGTP